MANMLLQRVWNQWEPLAPSPFVSFSDSLEQYSKQPAKWLVICVGIGLSVLKQGEIPDSPNEYLDNKTEMEESTKTIILSIYFLLFAALCVDLRTGNTISKWAYKAVLPTVGFTAAVSAYWLQQGRMQEDNTDGQAWNESVSIYTSDIHTSNLKFVSILSSFAAATIIPILFFSIPLNIVRAAAILFLLIFLPYFFDLSTVLWAAVAISIILIIMVGAVIVTAEIFGPCAGCITILAFYGSYAIDMSVDLIAPIFRSTKKFLSVVFEIY